MTRLVFVTQQVDREHPTLGAAADMVAALAARFDEVVIIAAAATVDALPANVRFRSFAAPTQLLRGLRFEAVLARELARGRPTALLAHMSPVYVVLAAPLLRPLRVPVLLWFTQQQAGANFYRSLRGVDAILSVDERSVPVSSPKIRAIGHGIDTDGFECAERRPRHDGVRLLSLGRYSKVKGHDVAVRALPALRGASLTVRGEEATPNDSIVRARLAALVCELGLEGRVHLLDAVPRGEVPGLFADADVLVNATHGMSADKVVFEALAACTPVVAASPVFDGLLPSELRFTDGDPAGLATAIRAATALPESERRRLRARVEAEHSVEHWADEVVTAVRLARG
ncbi:MAG TPA: glycosyltransferase family 4 protein [Gaiellaceae bacterium]|nr:glycosyltransferase family 4 protein [Gaiellaceae bacterium]